MIVTFRRFFCPKCIKLRLHEVMLDIGKCVVCGKDNVERELEVERFIG